MRSVYKEFEKIGSSQAFNSLAKRSFLKVFTGRGPTSQFGLSSKHHRNFITDSSLNSQKELPSILVIVWR